MKGNGSKLGDRSAQAGRMGVLGSERSEAERSEAKRSADPSTAARLGAGIPDPEVQARGRGSCQ